MRLHHAVIENPPHSWMRGDGPRWPLAEVFCIG